MNIDNLAFKCIQSLSTFNHIYSQNIDGCITERCHKDNVALTDEEKGELRQKIESALTVIYGTAYGYRW